MNDAPGRARVLGYLFVAVALASVAFCLVASVVDTAGLPRWLGMADVAVAAILVGIALMLAAATRASVTASHRLDAFRWTQWILGAIPALLAVYFICGARLRWEILVIGLAWRGWLVVYLLPHLAAALSRARS